MAQWVKNPPATQVTQIHSLGQEDPLEEGTATHSSILAWRIAQIEEPGRKKSQAWLKRLSTAHNLLMGNGRGLCGRLPHLPSGDGEGPHDQLPHWCRLENSWLSPHFGFPGGSDGKESAFYAGDWGSIHGSGKIPWKREWQPTPVFLPGEFHGRKSLVGCSPWGRKEWMTTTEWLTFTFSGGGWSFS